MCLPASKLAEFQSVCRVVGRFNREVNCGRFIANVMIMIKHNVLGRKGLVYFWFGHIKKGIWSAIKMCIHSVPGKYFFLGEGCTCLNMCGLTRWKEKQWQMKSSIKTQKNIIRFKSKLSVKISLKISIYGSKNKACCCFFLLPFVSLKFNLISLCTGIVI